MGKGVDGVVQEFMLGDLKDDALWRVVERRKVQKVIFDIYIANLPVSDNVAFPRYISAEAFIGATSLEFIKTLFPLGAS